MSATAFAVLTAIPQLSMSDLPNRPPRATERSGGRIGRSQPSTDKPEPRFEAARQRVAREDRLRARAEAIRQARREEAAAGPTEPAAEPATTRKGFSFNQTTRRNG